MISVWRGCSFISVWLSGFPSIVVSRGRSSCCCAYIRFNGNRPHWTPATWPSSSTEPMCDASLLMIRLLPLWTSAGWLAIQEGPWMWLGIEVPWWAAWELPFSLAPQLIQQRGKRKSKEKKKGKEAACALQLGAGSSALGRWDHAKYLHPTLLLGRGSGSLVSAWYSFAYHHNDNVHL